MHEEKPRGCASNPNFEVSPGRACLASESNRATSNVTRTQSLSYPCIPVDDPALCHHVDAKVTMEQEIGCAAKSPKLTTQARSAEEASVAIVDGRYDFRQTDPARVTTSPSDYADPMQGISH